MKFLMDSMPSIRRSNQSILKETRPEYSLEGLMLKLKLRYFDCLKKAELWRIDAFELWCWRRLLRAPWTARRSNQSIRKRSVLTIYWKDWCWSWNSDTLATWYEELTHWKRPWCWKRFKVEREGDDRGWDVWMASQEFQKTLGDSERQASLVCCSPRRPSELDIMEWLNNRIINRACLLTCKAQKWASYFQALVYTVSVLLPYWYLKT